MGGIEIVLFDDIIFFHLSFIENCQSCTIRRDQEGSLREGGGYPQSPEVATEKCEQGLLPGKKSSFES
ncbi:hypothetical protein XENORESO_021469 [Xenotaenia resolanae]|uniref:Uncharacterized protein n=1 Tax=Xenotaenia resolanae TaxID=208358 RepID=A0ABV0X4K5_9TELE